MLRTLFLCLCLTIFTGPADAITPWIHGDWQMRIPFDADPTLIEGSQTFDDFAMLVTLDGARHPDVFTLAKSDGSDLLFCSANGAGVLDREIVSYDPVGQTAEIWVRVPGLSKIDNGFYLYFQNPVADLDPTPPTAWSSDYRAVYHFEEDPADLLLTDSSPAAVNINLNATHGWTSSDAEPVKVGQGWHLNGTTHHIATKGISTVGESYTIEAWLTHDDASTDFFFQAQPDFWHLSSQKTGEIVDYAGPEGFVTWNPVPLPKGEPAHHYMWKFDAVDDTMLFYYDGIPQTTRIIFPAEFSPLYTGRTINPTNADPVGIVGPMYYVTEDFHSGQADEFRLREGRPSSARILTEFRNADDPVAFLSFGATESINSTGVASATRLRLRTYPNPSSGNSSVFYTLPAQGRVRISVYDVAGREVASVVDRSMPAGSWIARWDGRSQSGQRVAAGLYFLRLETPFGIRTSKLTVVR